MTRPHLINPKNWTPFKSIPVIQEYNTHNTHDLSVETPIERVHRMEVKCMSRKEILQRNSFWLNFFGIIIILGISYFFYSIYLERKIFSEYVEKENYPGFLSSF